MSVNIVLNQILVPKTSLELDVVSLHIHERISTRAILDAVRRPEPPQPDLFGETSHVGSHRLKGGA